MASGTTRVCHGAYVVDATPALISILTIGFRPTRVKLTNQAGDEAWWQDGMADDSMHKRTAAGVGSFVTSAAITPLANGFSIGTDADLNGVAAETVHFEVLD